MECGWGWEAVINLSKMMDYTFVLLSSSY